MRARRDARLFWGSPAGAHGNAAQGNAAGQRVRRRVRVGTASGIASLRALQSRGNPITRGRAVWSGWHGMRSVATTSLSGCAAPRERDPSIGQWRPAAEGMVLDARAKEPQPEASKITVEVTSPVSSSRQHPPPHPPFPPAGRLAHKASIGQHRERIHPASEHRLFSGRPEAEWMRTVLAAQIRGEPIKRGVGALT